MSRTHPTITMSRSRSAPLTAGPSSWRAGLTPTLAVVPVRLAARTLHYQVHAEPACRDLILSPHAWTSKSRSVRESVLGPLS